MPVSAKSALNSGLIMGYPKYMADISLKAEDRGWEGKAAVEGREFFRLRYEPAEIEKILDDVINAHNKFWDSILGRKEGEEGGEKKGFDIASTIREVRNRIRDFLGMEPLPEPESKEGQ
jgi:hypothetical protein